MKKVFYLTVAIATIFSLCSCNTKKNSNEVKEEKHIESYNDSSDLPEAGDAKVWETIPVENLSSPDTPALISKPEENVLEEGCLSIEEAKENNLVENSDDILKMEEIDSSLILKIDPIDVPIKSNTEVTFSVDVPEATKSTSVQLYEETENAPEFIGTLGTYGSTEYSGTFTVNSNKEGIKKYFAFINLDGMDNNIRTESKEINIYTPVSEDEFKNFDEVMNEITKKTESDYYKSLPTNDDKAMELESMLQEYKDKGYIISFERGGGPDSFWIKSPSGITGQILINGWDEGMK